MKRVTSCPLLHRLGGLLLFSYLPALAQLVGDGFEARRRLGGGFHIIVDLGGLLHGLATYREAGVVPRVQLFGRLPSSVSTYYTKSCTRGHIVLEFAGLEGGGENIRVVLGGIEGILYEGDAIRICLEHRFPLFGGKADEKRHLLENGIEGGLDGLDIGGREGCVDVLVWSGKFLGVGFLCGCGTWQAGVGRMLVLNKDVENM